MKNTRKFKYNAFSLYGRLFLYKFFGIWVHSFSKMKSIVERGKTNRGAKLTVHVFFFLKLIKEVKIKISRNRLLRWIEISLKFSKLYTFFRFDHGNVIKYRGKVVWLRD